MMLAAEGCDTFGVYVDITDVSEKNDYLVFAVCEAQVLVNEANEGDGDTDECMVKPVEEKIRRQMYARTF